MRTLPAWSVARRCTVYVPLVVGVGAVQLHVPEPSVAVCQLADSAWETNEEPFQ